MVEIVDGWVVTDSTVGPSQKMAKLESWKESDAIFTTPESSDIQLGSRLCSQQLIQNFAQNFANKITFKAPSIKLINEPFQVCTVDDFVTDKALIPKLVAEMESMEWTRKQMDLYEFHQTTDLANITSQHISQFFSFLTTDVRSWMEQLTGMRFKKVSASCSMYNCGDYLLTHDDLLTDRLIAFVFYLSPWGGKEIWNESMGGALELFKVDRDGQPMYPAVKKIQPANNRFVFFKVEKKSQHQVGEVVTKEWPRLTINGWFHGFMDNADFDIDALKVKVPNVPIFKSPVNAEKILSQFINKTYLKESIKSSVQKQIEENSEAALGEFLINELHKKVAQELTDSALSWTLKGPSNQQNYECLSTDGLKANSSIKQLLDLMISKAMFKLLHEFTELDLYGAAAKKPKCTIEMQRWKGGCYTLIGDPSTYNSDTLDLILYFGSNDNIGVITYLTPEDDSAETASNASSDRDEPVLLTIFPQNNFLNIVYRSQGTAKFTKYCSKASLMDTDFNYILFCSYQE